MTTPSPRKEKRLLPLPLLLRLPLIAPDLDLRRLPGEWFSEELRLLNGDLPRAEDGLSTDASSARCIISALSAMSMKSVPEGVGSS